jgi:metal-responsive CopG/Arc/MetJ family transcriptional regulator
MSADIPSDLTDAETARITVSVPLSTKEELNRIAYEETTPSRRVTMSEVARKALSDFVEDYEAESNEGAA